MPFQICFFETSNEPKFLSTLQNLNDIIFLVDIALNFFFVYYDREEILIVSRLSIAKHYLCSYFVLDLTASFPYEIFFPTSD